jgi:hypothetical protein
MIFILWWLLIILAANPQWLRLPGADIISNFTVFIAFYFPASVIVGSGIEWIPLLNLQSVNPADPVYQKKWRVHLFSSLLLVLTIGLGSWALPRRIQDLDLSAYALMTRPDLRAMAWIRDQTSSDASFLINSFFAYNNTLVAGSDGGWWLPLLAGRKTSLPPLTYSFEEGTGSTNLGETNNLSREIQEKGITNKAVISMLQERGIGYVYIGQRQGRVNYNGPDVLNPQVITQDANFDTIYHQDRVWIFKIVP